MRTKSEEETTKEGKVSTMEKSPKQTDCWYYGKPNNIQVHCPKS